MITSSGVVEPEAPVEDAPPTLITISGKLEPVEVVVVGVSAGVVLVDDRIGVVPVVPVGAGPILMTISAGFEL